MPQTSFGPLPHTASSAVWVVLRSLVQNVPFQWMMEEPTAQTSLGPLPHTALRYWAPASWWTLSEDQTRPSQCSVTALVVPPTAQTSLGPLPQTPLSASVTPLALGDSAVPFQCRSVPPSPTIQTSSERLPHTPRKIVVGSLRTRNHAVPFQCRIVLSPTAHRSLVALPHTAKRSLPLPLPCGDRWLQHQSPDE